jgi:hypothetical protein
MTTPTRPRRRLPARVYWVRRTLVLLTALALVFAIGRMLGGSGGSGSGADQATVTGSRTSTSPSKTPNTTPSYGPLGVTTTTPSAKPTGTAPPVVLAEPTGPCALDEITVTPTITSAPAGRPVPLTLQLTGMRPACTFVVTTRSLAVRVTSGSDRNWTSQQCPRAIRTQTVTVRSAAPATITVDWSGRRSDETCSRSAGWALPGYYHLTAAVIGSEPGDAQFRLTSPPRPVVTKTIKPKPKKGHR